MRFFSQQRLRHRADFERLQQHGLRIHCGAFIFQAALREDHDPAALPRLGVITSRRVGSAVVRNRGRRLMREIFRRHPGVLPNGCDVVIIMRSTFLQESFPGLESRFLKACRNFRQKLSSKEDPLPHV